MDLEFDVNTHTQQVLAQGSAVAEAPRMLPSAVAEAPQMGLALPPAAPTAAELADTPERRRLRNEITTLLAREATIVEHANIEFASQRDRYSEAAREAIAHQRQGFENTANLYVEQARDVIQAETAQQRANYEQELHRARQILEQDAQRQGAIYRDQVRRGEESVEFRASRLVNETH